MWEQLFQSHILARGLDYSIRDLVKIIQLTEEKVLASVYGTEEYTVEIIRKNGRILSLTCDCPHAVAGNHCKHMAAVMYTMQNENSPQTAKQNKEEILDLVHAAEPSFLIEFLINTLINDEKLLNSFKKQSIQELSPHDVEAYKDQIINIFNEYTDDYDFIDYGNAFGFISELEDILDEDIQNMIKNEYLEEAFELTNFIFLEIGNQAMDDSDGGITIIATNCLEIWEKIISKSTIEFKRKIFAWFIQNMNSAFDYMEDYLLSVLFENFYEDEFLTEKLDFIDKQITKFKNKKDSWSREYKLNEFAMYRIETLEKMNVDSMEIETYCLSNLQLRDVRKYYIDRCINNKEYDKAIALLKEGKNKENIYIGEREYYIVKLKNLYKFLGENELYEKELRELLIDYELGGIDTYKELKELYSEEDWLEEREQILNKLATHRDIDTYYAFEGLYDRLLEIVVNSYGLFKLIEHEAILKPLYPKELLLKYEDVVEAMAEESLGRKHYRKIISILRKMKIYPEGKSKVTSIVDRWKTMYNNRPAMMDELNKL